MKVSKAKAAENRAALVDAAAKLLKQKGFEGAGVVEICANAGLTQGAFYGQFPAKSAIAAEACRHDLERGRDAWAAKRGSTDNDALAFIQEYLRKGHVDDIGTGCPMATYSGDIVRQDKEVAAAFLAGTSEMIKLMEEALVEKMPPASARSRALFLIAALSGTVAMVRAIGRSNPKLAQEMLRASLQEAGLLTIPGRPKARS